ncbi:hypothetical protein F5880DRAFT_1614073 [Lentinula raphanica]|nr:hypothetical protein F5880DRAFT_1614073 [Lentinula raphanica]
MSSISSSKRRFDYIQHPHSHMPAAKRLHLSNTTEPEYVFPSTWQQLMPTNTNEPLIPPALFTSSNVDTKDTLSSDSAFGVHALDALGLFTIVEDTDTDGNEGDGIDFTLEELEAQTYNTSLQMKDEMMGDKATASAYRRHLQNYMMFLAENHQHLPAIPITATKVSLFLDYEIKRPKRTHNGLDILGTRVGLEHIKQCISALEHHRFHHKHEPRYVTEPKSQIPLRDDTRIQTFEKMAKANRPNAIAESHSWKAAGTSAGDVNSHLTALYIISLLTS